MKSVEQVIKPYKRKAVITLGDYYFASEDGLHLIRECESNNLAIIGVEGFLLENSDLTPRLDLIADYSNEINDRSKDWQTRRSTCNKAAATFIKKYQADRLVFSLVIKSPET